LAATLSNMGELEHLRGNNLAAQGFYSRSRQLMEKTGCVDDLPELLRRTAESLSALGLHDESRTHVTSGHRMAEEIGCRLEAANCLRVLAEFAAEAGEFEQARDRCRTAIDSLKLLGASYELGQAVSALGRIEVVSGHPDTAVRHFEEARAVFLRLGARRDARLLQEQLAEMAGAVSYPTPELPGERERLAALYKSSQALAVVATIEELIREAADAVAAEILSDTAAVVLVDPTGPARVVFSTMSETNESSEGLASLVPVLLAQLRERGIRAWQLPLDEASASLAPLLSSRGIRRLLVVPMISGARLLGALYLDYRQRDGHFSEEDIRFAEALAAQAATAIENSQLRAKLEDEIELLRWEVDARHSFANIIGQSLEMQQLFTLVEKVSRTSVTVLIEGESGTGKELVARAIHNHGPRKNERFVAQNCAALPEQLLESELFGHVRGSFTGAFRDKPGLFEAADRGTFFLDEIADMPQSLQVKLLRVLQDGEIRRVGATDSISVDVRIIAATNKLLDEEVQRGRFREDLFYRLNVVRVGMPPLRVRRDDIPLLAQHFLNRFTEKSGRSDGAFSERAMELLVNYDWPGNVRELENEIERAVALSDRGAAITAMALSERIRSVPIAIKPPKPGTKLSLKDMVEDVEKRVILQMLRENNWNKSRTAIALGLSRQGLLKKIARFGLHPDEE